MGFATNAIHVGQEPIRNGRDCSADLPDVHVRQEEFGNTARV